MSRHSTPPSPTVTALYRYPIKSCRGQALDAAEIGRRGISHDREFMVVDAATGVFLTQREIPRLALVAPTLEDDRLRLSAPGVAALDVEVVRDGPARQVVVWRDTCVSVDQGAEAAEWLGDYLGTACRLVRMADDHVRPVDPVFARRDDDQVGFADGYPLLLAAEESLADLNRRMGTPLPMNRFRPNMVVAGTGGPFAEDGWRRIRVGGVVFHLVKPCARCVTTTVDQDTARTGVEPLATLATFRRGERGVLFGQNLVHEAPGVVRRGDPVELLD